MGVNKETFGGGSAEGTGCDTDALMVYGIKTAEECRTRRPICYGAIIKEGANQGAIQR